MITPLQLLYTATSFGSGIGGQNIQIELSLKLSKKNDKMGQGYTPSDWNSPDWIHAGKSKG